jgi:2-polyprenyl-3-methyl-5-hydroxy-6-metoxy-1,4-benzoquinol methylase
LRSSATKQDYTGLYNSRRSKSILLLAVSCYPYCMKSNTSFNHIAEIWDAKTGEAGKGIKSNKITAGAILDELTPLKGKKIYEIACGNGFLSRLLKQAVNEVRASDISESLIEFAKNKYETKGIKYEVRDATDFSKMPSSHFDAVVMHQGIFYIKDLRKLAKGINKILKPGGVVIFSDMHPLMYVAEADNNKDLQLEELIERYQLYLKSRMKTVKKNWPVGNERKSVEYFQFKRPLSEYINAFGENGLPTVKILEPKTLTMIKGKTKRSKIPSDIIVKCVKAKY